MPYAAIVIAIVGGLLAGNIYGTCGVESFALGLITGAAAILWGTTRRG